MFRTLFAIGYLFVPHMILFGLWFIVVSLLQLIFKPDWNFVPQVHLVFIVISVLMLWLARTLLRKAGKYLDPFDLKFVAWLSLALAAVFFALVSGRYPETIPIGPIIVAVPNLFWSGYVFVKLRRSSGETA